MLIECQNCGAPLNVKPKDRIARCAYCGSDNQVNRTRTIAQQTPPGWRPPQLWVPPAQFPAPSVEIQLNPALVRRGGGCSILAAVAGLVVTGGAAAVVLLAMPSGGGGGGISLLEDKATSWDGKSTLHCSTNESLTIENKTANVASGPVISAGTNCRLTIINSTLTGQTGIQGEMNVTVELRNSRIEATQVGVGCGVNCSVSLRDKSRISGKEFGVRGDVGVKVDLRDSIVISQEVGIQGGPTLSVTGRTCDIQGAPTAIQGGMASKVDLVSCTVRGRKDLQLGSSISER